jgi:hypothetical protein
LKSKILVLLASLLALHSTAVAQVYYYAGFMPQTYLNRDARIGLELGRTDVSKKYSVQINLYTVLRSADYKELMDKEVNTWGVSNAKLGGFMTEGLGLKHIKEYIAIGGMLQYRSVRTSFDNPFLNKTFEPTDNLLTKQNYGALFVCKFATDINKRHLYFSTLLGLGAGNERFKVNGAKTNGPYGNPATVITGLENISKVLPVLRFSLGWRFGQAPAKSKS